MGYSWWVGGLHARGYFLALDQAVQDQEDGTSVDGQVAVYPSAQAAAIAARHGCQQVYELEAVGPVTDNGDGSHSASQWISVRAVSPRELYGDNGERVDWLLRSLATARPMTNADARDAANCILESLLCQSTELRLDTVERDNLQPIDQALAERVERPQKRPAETFEALDWGLRLEARARSLECQLRAAQAAVRSLPTVAPALDSELHAEALEAQRFVEAVVAWSLLRDESLSPFDAALDLIRSGRVPAFVSGRLTCVRTLRPEGGRWLSPMEPATDPPAVGSAAGSR